MPLPGAPPAPPRDGRSVGWRLAMVLVAAVFGGAAAALVFWPAALSWAVAVILAVGALFFLVSAVLARSRR